MVQTAAKVVTGKGKIGGYMFRAPLGTALPTSEATALSAAYIDQGYASSDGFKRAIAKAYQVIRDQRGDEVKRAKTQTSVTLELTLIEANNPEVIKSVFATSNVTVSAATASAGTKIAVAYNGAEPAQSVWVTDLADDNGALKRIVFPNSAIVTESFETEYSNSKEIQIPVTLTCYKDAAGNFFYEYTDDGIKAV